MMQNIMEQFKTAPGNLVFPDGSSVTRDSRVTGLNNNVLAVGPSGCGKSSTLGIPNLIEGNSSFVVSDPKGTLYRMVREDLERLGYEVLLLDLTHPERSAKYNPLVYAHKPQEIRRIAHAIIAEGNPNHQESRDPYWEHASESMLCAIIAMLRERCDNYKQPQPFRQLMAPEGCPPAEPWPEPTLSAVSELLSSMEVCEDLDDREKAPGFREFYDHQNAMNRLGKKSWACRMFAQFKSLSEKTLSCVNSTLASLLVPFEGEEMEALFSGHDFDFRAIGQEKTAIFVIVSDSDRSNDLLANIFYTQVMNELCDYADNECEDGRLPVPVTFLLDDFSTNCHIYGFENMISNIRARNISTMLMIQSIHQLTCGYGEAAETILNNCDTTLFMGANSLADAEYFAKRANVAVHTMLDKPRFSSWLFRHGQKPRFMQNQNPMDYLARIHEETRLVKSHEQMFRRKFFNTLRTCTEDT